MVSIANITDGVRPSFLSETPCNTSAAPSNADRTCYVQTMKLFDTLERSVLTQSWLVFHLSLISLSRQDLSLHRGL